MDFWLSCLSFWYADSKALCPRLCYGTQQKVTLPSFPLSLFMLTLWSCIVTGWRSASPVLWASAWCSAKGHMAPGTTSVTTGLQRLSPFPKITIPWCTPALPSGVCRKLLKIKVTQFLCSVLMLSKNNVGIVISEKEWWTEKESKLLACFSLLFYLISTLWNFHRVSHCGVVKCMEYTGKRSVFWF